MNDDLKHIRLLATFHYVLGGMTFLFSLIPMIHVVIGWIAIVSPEKMMGHDANAMPPLIGWMFLLMGIVFVSLGIIFAAVIAVSGRKLSKLTSYWFSFVVACVECIFMPFGTVLGIFTIMVLSRESVKALYGIKEQAGKVSGP